MSHKATNWAIAQRGLRPTAKIILWHLCDRHHPDHGCFPSQATLADDCEISRGTLNSYLKELEAEGLIRRVQRVDEKNRRQMSTLYLFAFDFGDPYAFDPSAPAPEKGPDGGQNSGADTGEKGEKPCSNSGHGAVSKKPRKPCSKNGQSRVQNLDTNPVREPINNQRARTDLDPISEIAAFWARKIADGGFVPDSALTQAVRSEIVRAGLLTEQQMIDRGIIASGVAAQRRAKR